MEVRLFRLGDEGYVVVPAVVAKTAEIERAVVRVERGPVTVETPRERAAQVGRRVLSEEALRVALRRQPDGEVATQVADRLLDLISPPLEVTWRSSSFAVIALDPGGSGRAPSLCVVDTRGHVWAYVPWLADQPTAMWGNEEAVRQMVDAHAAVFRRYGAKVQPSGRQYDLRLSALAGREQEFVTDLAGLVTILAGLATKPS